jgi:hypothetical protein
MIEHDNDNKTKLQCMSLIKDITNSQLDLVSNVNVIDNILNTLNSDNENKTSPISLLTNTNSEDISNEIFVIEGEGEGEEDKEEERKQSEQQ